MQRPSRPLRAPRLFAPLAALLLAVPALVVPTVAGAQQNGYDPARVQSISDPRFQRQVMQSSQAVAEALVGRRANSTDQEILRKFSGQQSTFLRTLENAARAMPEYGSGTGYNGGNDNSYGYDNNSNSRGMSSADLQAVAELSRTPEGRRVLQQLTNQRYNDNAGYDGYQQQGGYSQGNYSQGNQQKPGQVLRDALLQDLTNAASNAAYGQPVYRSNGVHP